MTFAGGRWAQWHAPFSDVVAHAGFTEAFDGAELFCVLHLPSKGATTGMVVCSPVHAEFAKNYHREVLLARSLSAVGFPTVRFHYRGAGNSEGASGSETETSMRQDALRVAELLVARSGVTRLAFLGTRVGGLVAAQAAEQLAGSPLALWEPVTKPKAYFRELFRATIISALKHGARPPSSADSFVRELEQDGFIDVLGYPITRAFYDSVMDAASLAYAASDIGGPLFLGQMCVEGGLRRDLVTLQKAWMEVGCSVETALTFADEAWWFGSVGSSSSKSRLATLPLVDTTSRWMTQVVGGARP